MGYQKHNWFKRAFGGVCVGIVVCILAYSFTNSPLPSRSVDIDGDNTPPGRLVDSSGVSNSINQLSPEVFARAVLENLPGEQGFLEQDEKIRNLKSTIERLQRESGDELKQSALEALAYGDIPKAAELMEEVARIRTGQVEPSNKKAAREWIDAGNISRLGDSGKALNAYKTAVKLDSTNAVAWNRLGHLSILRGLLEESEKAYIKVTESPGDQQGPRQQGGDGKPVCQSRRYPSNPRRSGQGL